MLSTVAIIDSEALRLWLHDLRLLGPRPPWNAVPTCKSCPPAHTRPASTRPAFQEKPWPCLAREGSLAIDSVHGGMGSVHGGMASVHGGMARSIRLGTSSV